MTLNVSSSSREASISPGLAAIGLVVGAAALEGLAAGPAVKARLADLRMPSPSPPFSIWLGIGAFYYLTCFALALRLLGSTSPGLGRDVALALLILLLLGNAAWNLAFFRRRNLALSWRISVGYAVLAPVLAVTLLTVERPAFWLFLPYLVYLGYGTWWVWAVYRLNTAAGVT